MPKKTGKSQGSTSGGTPRASQVIVEKPLDMLHVNIRSLRLSNEDAPEYTIWVTYYDQVILSTIVKPIGTYDLEQSTFIAQGTMSYDPSNFEKMCQFADSPLVVKIQPVKNKDSDGTSKYESKIESHSKSSFTNTSSLERLLDTSCCNIDILPIFLGYEDIDKLYVKKRMEPTIKPSVLETKSWDCLPLITMEISVERDKENAPHHDVLREANWMKLTLVAVYNMILPFESSHLYTAASKTPLHCILEEYSHTGIVRFNAGSQAPKHFNPTIFYPKWESLNVEPHAFVKADKKFVCNLGELQNEDNIDINYYVNKKSQDNTVVWCSFHRSLLIEKSSEEWLENHIRDYKWPFELNITVEDGSYSFMAFMNLFKLLYPGVDTVRLAVPLQWLNSTRMLMECNCYPLLTSFYTAPSSTPPKGERQQTDTSVTTDTDMATVNTGADNSDAFIIVEVKLSRPLVKAAIPSVVLKDEMMNMLKTMESTEVRRHCVGRVVFPKSWQSTVRNVATALRKAPFYGMTEPPLFIRQLSETKTRVEISTAFWQSGALYANNNFVIQQYLHSEEIYEEMVMMTHGCLMQLAVETLEDNDQIHKDVDPVLRAARQARQMRDVRHAMELYLQVIVKRPRDSNIWRELSTCMKDINREWARVALNSSIMLNPRHPLTLVSICGMLYEEDPVAAEQFIVALLALYPFWIMAYTIASAYYYERQQFILSEKIMMLIQKTERDGEAEQMPYVRGWERELGDWWESTQLLPGMNHFYNAADLLLRLRCVAFAEVCLARALLDVGESCVYYHLIALCCRLRGQYDDALCHLRVGINMYGEISYLRSLEADCYHMLGNISDSMASYEKLNDCRWPFTILMMLPIYSELNQKLAVLTDLVRQFPSAYSWVALAHNWLTSPEKNDDNPDNYTSPTNCAAACVVQAIKWDRMAGGAWALLANMVKPSARRFFCLKMATLCGYNVNRESGSTSQQSSCFGLGTAITDCHCRTCDRLRL